MARNADRCHPSRASDSFGVQPVSFGVSNSAKGLGSADNNIPEQERRERRGGRGQENIYTTRSFTDAETLADSRSTSAAAPDEREKQEVETGGWKHGLSAVDAVLKRLDVIHSKTEEENLIARLVCAEQVFVVSFVNQHAMNLAWRSPDFASCLLGSDILLRDGIGVEVCLAILGRGVGLNMNGTDFIPRLATAFRGRRTVIFGTAEPWTSGAATALAALGCKVVGAMDGFRPEPDYVAEVARKEPELVILAMGNPKQEAVAKAIASSAASPMVIVNGGAIADFLSHRFERAPPWLRSVRCEWFFRMLQEPRRLWRRYLLGGVSFARCVMLLRLASR
jgi:exopolysaccharide biosynthesis WecB/TagA/CpsF family protein